LFVLLGVVSAAAPASAQLGPFSRCDTVPLIFGLIGFPLGFDMVRLFVGTGDPGSPTRVDITPDSVTPSTITMTFDLRDLPNQPGGPTTNWAFRLIVRDIATGQDVTATATFTVEPTPGAGCARNLADLINMLGQYECPVYPQISRDLAIAAATTGTTRCDALRRALNCVQALVRSEIQGGLRDPLASADPLLGNFRWSRLRFGTAVVQSAQSHARLLEDELITLRAALGCSP
jgi:hypothetical protein